MLHIAALESEVTIDDAARQEIARRQRSLAYAGAAWVDDESLSPEENERLFYILHVACASADDLQAFGRAVTARSVADRGGGPATPGHVSEATYRGRDLFSFRQIPRSGIQYSLVLEWYFACRWANLDWFGGFDELDGDDAAFIIAAYRTHMQIEAVTAYFASKKKH
jgi:hypothetical protein